MKKFKKILATTATMGISTTATLSTVACDNYSLPQLDSKYAQLLGWYDTDGNSLISQKLNYDNTSDSEKYLVIADDHLMKINSLFSKLLRTGAPPHKYRAVNANAAHFLEDLGFKSGDEIGVYSDEEYAEIVSLTVSIKNTFPGEIKEKYTEDSFELEAGKCQIDIIKNNEILKSYIINTADNKDLDVSQEFRKILPDLKLYNNVGVKKGSLASDFKLEFAPYKQKQWEALISLLNTKVYTFFYDAAKNGNKITRFVNVQRVWLQVDFGKVNALKDSRIGSLPVLD